MRATRAVARTVVSQTSGLRNYLQQHRDTLAAAPILLLQSNATNDDKDNKQVQLACRHVQHVLQSCNLRTVSSGQASAVAAYPVASDVLSVQDLGRRVGATTVISVGSAAAMDLAKATVVSSSTDNTNTTTDNTNRDWETLILVPATAQATFAAACSRALLLDAKEEALVVTNSTTSTSTTTLDTVHVALEESLMDSSRQAHVLLACASIALDCLVQGRETDIAAAVLQDVLQCLEQESESSTSSSAALVHETITTAGQLVSFGVSQSEGDRSLPLALAASLTPQHFEQYDVVEFMASLLPALVHQMSSSGSSNTVGLNAATLERLTQVVSQQHVPRMVTTESLDTLLASVRQTQVLWNCVDANNNQLAAALSEHMLV